MDLTRISPKLNNYSADSAAINAAQMRKIYAAIWGMHEGAKQGIREAAQLASERVRESYINAIAQITPLPRHYIEQAVHVDVQLEQGAGSTLINPHAAAPTARVTISIDRSPIPLERFDVSVSNRGVSVLTNFTRSARELPDAFTGPRSGLEIFQREGESRYPIRMLFGPSVHGLLTETGGLVEQQAAEARRILTEAVMEVRDRVINQLIYEDNPKLGVSGKLLGELQKVGFTGFTWAGAAASLPGRVAGQLRQWFAPTTIMNLPKF